MTHAHIYRHTTKCPPALPPSFFLTPPPLCPLLLTSIPSLYPHSLPPSLPLSLALLPSISPLSRLSSISPPSRLSSISPPSRLSSISPPSLCPFFLPPYLLYPSQHRMPKAPAVPHLPMTRTKSDHHPEQDVRGRSFSHSAPFRVGHGE